MMCETGDIQNKWELLLSLFTKNDDVFKEEVFNYENEVKSMRYLYGPTVIRDTFHQWLSTLDQASIKSDKASNAVRDAGNRVFRQRTDDSEAVSFYTRAILCADSNECAAMAYANRASSLMRLSYYKESLDDCEMAESLGYPRHNFVKILYRKAKCALLLKDSKTLDKCIEDFKILSKEGAVNRNVEMLFLEIQNKRKDIKTKAYLINNTNEDEKDIHLPNRKQEVRYKKSKGRYVVASEFIPKDTEILTEKAFCFVPVVTQSEGDEAMIDRRCHQCADVDIIPFPCHNCGRATYCSLKCKAVHQRIHEIECTGYKMNLWKMIGISHLAFRVLIVGLHDLLRELCGESENMSNQLTPENLMDKALKMACEKKSLYSDVLGLVTNLGSMAPSDLLKIGLTASMLCCYLVNFTNFCVFMEDFKPLQKESFEIFISSLLLKHTAQMICNAHSVTQLEQTKRFQRNIAFELPSVPCGQLGSFATKITTFAAIFPTISLYNHSCEPNIRNRYNLDFLTVLSSKDIKKNEDILNCYGNHYKLLDASRRKRFLFEQYAFECKCNHCTNFNDKVFQQFHTYICQNCKEQFVPETNLLYWWREDDLMNVCLNCPHCKSTFDCNWFLTIEAIVQRYSAGCPAKSDYDKAINIYESLTFKLSKYHQVKQYVAEQILNIFRPVIGQNTSTRKKLVEIAIELLNATEMQMGQYSLEYVLASTYLLDLLADLNEFKTNSSYSLSKILNSFQVLSDKFRIIFENYYETRIKIKDI